MNPYFITGTGTDIGKTWLSCALLSYWRAHGMATCAFKPVLSGFNDADAANSDAGALLLAQGIGIAAGDADVQAELESISPWRFSAALSPDMAAALEGRHIDFNELVAFTRRCSREFAMHGIAPAQRVGSAMPTLHTNSNRQTAHTLVEGVGGVMVPLDGTHTVRDWIAASGLPCVLVAGSYLGSLSHTLTALAALTQTGVQVAAIAVNESAPSTVPLSSAMASLIRHAGGHAVIAIERDNPAPGIAQLAMHLESRPVYTARHPDQP